MLQLVRAKNEEAVGLLFHQVKSFLKKYLHQQTTDVDFYSNLLASTAITIIIEKETEPILTCKLCTYAIEIAKRQWSLIERKKHEIPLTDKIAAEAMAMDDIYQEVERAERKHLVYRCLKDISKKCQKLLKMYLEDLSPEEASRELGYRSSKVYLVKKSECFKRLKTAITQSPECSELFDNK